MTLIFPWTSRPTTRELLFTIINRLNILETHMSDLRDAFEADEQAITDQLTTLNTNVSDVVTAIQNLPASVDNLTQADLDRVKGQGDALGAANDALSAALAPPTA